MLTPLMSMDAGRGREAGRMPPRSAPDYAINVPVRVAGATPFPRAATFYLPAALYASRSAQRVALAAHRRRPIIP
jgi:hypothetical protein